MKQNYDFCIKEVLKSEGGYTNDPADSGGETNFGITQRETSIPVKTMTVEQAKAIYKKKYWDAVDGDNLPSGVDYTVFDYGVNSGVARAKKVYNSVKSPDAVKVINVINDERQSFLNNLAVRRPKDQKFLKGWTSRVSRVRADSLRLTKQPISGVGHAASAGSTVIAGGAALAATPTHYWPYIIGGVVVVLVIIGIVYYLKHKEK